jgi:hypothetical protein
LPAAPSVFLIRKALFLSLKNLTKDIPMPTQQTVDIWPFFRGQYKVYVEDATLKDRIAGWQDCRVHCVYYNRQFRVVAWDIIFSSKLYNRVAELCGLPPKQKSPGRVAHGKRLGARAKALGHVGVQNRGDFPIVDFAQIRRNRRVAVAPSMDSRQAKSAPSTADFSSVT